LVIVRPAAPGDYAAVRACNDLAFGQLAEGRLVEALRSSGDAAIELVAEEGGAIVGHVLLSRLVSPANCLALAPVSVLPERQRQGVGSALIEQVVEAARGGGYDAVFLVGEPGYYSRFGFSVAAAGRFSTKYPKEYTMALALRPNAFDSLSSEIVYAPAFDEAL
jgi:putative acetyltransferase